ncbi:hypothetical protein [Gaiella sp.]|uniref:hypothetical protein n=1 Tax=Gaiella sp. TaxID=2663207 RepID=UPI0032674E09
MRRTVTIALGTAAALATAAVAFAVVPAVVGINPATATFSTATIEKSKTRSCAADTKTWEITRGHYTGSVVSGNSMLAGSLKIHAKTTYNTTDKLGYVDGSFRIKDDDSRFKGKFAGTIKDGKLVGFLTGKSHGNHAKVLGNLSADFAGGATNFTNGKIGAESSDAVLAIVAGPVCKSEKSGKSGKSGKSEKARRIEVKGEISAIGTSPTTVTVTGKDGSKTCAIDAGYPIPDGFPVGTKDVEMKCKAIGDSAVWTLRKLEKDS